MESKRYPLSVRLIGVMHKEKSKMYMTSVLWSDQNDIVVYRSFRDFKKMHKQMKKAFPPANPLKRSDRIIPKFQDKKMKRSGGRKGPSKSLVRLKFLEKYCNELLSCDPRITEAQDLITFFRPKDQDLQPEFAKNSIMILPTDDSSGGDGGHDSLNPGTVTQPFVTEQYRCVATYETKDTKNKPFKVALDEKVDVLIKDKAGWWLVENEDKRMAWFPAPYLEKDDDEDVDEDDMDGPHGRGVLYTAVKSYKATKDDEMTVEIGSVVEVLQKSDNGWWLIRYGGKAGYIPAMFLKSYNSPRVRMAALQQNLHGSTLNLCQPQFPSSSSSSLALPQSQQVSLSQGNLLQLSYSRPSSPSVLQPADKHKSRSLNMLAKRRPATTVPSTSTSATTSPTGVVTSPITPTIMVSLDGDEDMRVRSSTGGSDESLGSDSSDFSFSDLSSSSESSSLNQSAGIMDERLRHSRTPEPMSTNLLSPTTEAKMVPSISDPNLYKGPVTPKVPPRPRAQEILTRCTTITRKNVSRAGRSPVQSEILSR